MRSGALNDRRCRRVLLAAACAVLLGGCWNGRVLFTYEPPFWSALGDPSALRAAMTATALARGYLPRFDINPGVDPAASLAASLAAGSNAVVVVGPLLSFQWADFVPRYPRTRFVLIDVPPPAQPPPNAVFLSFDRTPAFQEAGMLAAQSAAAARGLVGILSCEGSGLSAEESDAFARGAAAVPGGEVPQQETLGAAPDPRDVRAAVQQMQGRGVAVFLLGLGDRDPDGLEAVRDAGALAVVTDWRSSQDLPRSVLASIEEEVTPGIARALDALHSATARVEGPVRVVRGRKI